VENTAGIDENRYPRRRCPPGRLQSSENGLLTLPFPPGAAELSTCAMTYGLPVAGSTAATPYSTWPCGVARTV